MFQKHSCSFHGSTTFVQSHEEEDEEEVEDPEEEIRSVFDDNLGIILLISS